MLGFSILAHTSHPRCFKLLQLYEVANPHTYNTIYQWLSNGSSKLFKQSTSVTPSTQLDGDGKAIANAPITSTANAFSVEMTFSLMCRFSQWMLNPLESGGVRLYVDMARMVDGDDVTSFRRQNMISYAMVSSFLLCNMIS